MPLISVILTTFNREELLYKTIDSILKQTFYDFELIVVDNYSDYDFFKFIDHFNDNRIKAFQNSNNGVIATNRNFGLNIALGKFVAFCDDDDIWLPIKLEEQIKAMNLLNARRENILIHSNTILFGDNFKSRETKKKNAISFNDFILNNQISFSTVLVTRTAHVKFNEDPNLRASEDFNLWVELMLNGYKFSLIDQALVYYRVTSSSASSLNRELNSLRYIYVLLINLLKYKKIKGINYLLLVFKVNVELLKFVFRSLISKK